MIMSVIVMTVTMMMVMVMMVLRVMIIIMVIPLDHGVVDWAAVRQEKGVAEVFHLE